MENIQKKKKNSVKLIHFILGVFFWPGLFQIFWPTVNHFTILEYIVHFDMMFHVYISSAM